MARRGKNKLAPETSVDSREEFVSQVARLIQEAQADDDRRDSFIFGLSAKWGEGKTTFLGQLKNKLGEGSIVVDVNPWKYSDNKITFLQSFLLDLLEKSPKIKIKQMRNEILQTRTKSAIEWKKSAKAFAAICGATALYVGLAIWATLTYKNDSNASIVISLSATPTLSLIVTFISNLMQKGATASVTDKATSMLIGFDGIYKQIVASYKKKKIVIYVDDLDRVSAKSAILVLDNLRTFFDKPELCFIVSGDHSVIERHIGRELLPDSKTQEYLEEGRRYLKKVFNVYWRLPILIDAEIKPYIDGQIKEKLEEFKLSSKEKDQLSYFLNALFDNNFRNIERMVSQIAFTLRIVGAKRKGCKNETKIYYDDLHSHRLLLIKVLLIQELANPYYEYLLTHYDCLRRSDRTWPIQILYENGTKTEKEPELLSDKQKDLLSTILGANPRFHGENGIVVRDMKPFIYLSADSSFGDHMGLLPSEFARRLYEVVKTDEQFRTMLDQHSLEAIQDGVKFIREHIGTNDDESDALAPNILSRLMISLNGLPEEYEDKKKLFHALLDVKTILSVTTDLTILSEILFELGTYADVNSLVVSDDEIAEAAKQYSTLPQFIILLNCLSGYEKANRPYSDIVWSSFSAVHAQYSQFINSFTVDVLSKLGKPKLSKEALNALANTVKAQYHQAVGAIFAQILNEAGDQEVNDAVIEHMKNLLMQQQANSVNILKAFSGVDLSACFADVIESATTLQDLANKMRFSISSGLLSELEVWTYVAEHKSAIILANLPASFQSYYSHGVPNPSADIATLLAQKTILYAKETGKRDLLNHILTSNYYFKNLNRVSGNAIVTKYLKNLIQSGDTPVVQNANRLLTMGESPIRV